MIDDTTREHEDERDRDRKKKPGSGLPAPVDPIVKSTPLFEWLTELFFGEQNYPEHIDINVMYGAHMERTGPMVKQFIFRPDQYKDGKKPSTEELVKLQHQILGRIQNDCNESGKPHVYGVLPYHFSRGDRWYDRWLIHAEPEGSYRKGDAGVKLDLGMAGFGDDGEDAPMQERYAVHALRRDEKMFQLYAAAMEGIVDRQDRLIEKLTSSIDKKDERYEGMQDIVERARTLEDERKAKAEWRGLAIKLSDRGATMAIDVLFPAIMSKIGAKGLPANAETAESKILKDFFKPHREGGRLTDEESALVFGVYDESEDGRPIVRKAGVLSIAQTQLLYEIANCVAPASELEKFRAGPLEITPQQINDLGRVIGMDRLASIGAMIAARSETK